RADKARKIAHVEKLRPEISAHQRLRGAPIDDEIAGEIAVADSSVETLEAPPAVVVLQMPGELVFGRGRERQSADRVKLREIAPRKVEREIERAQVLRVDEPAVDGDSRLTDRRLAVDRDLWIVDSARAPAHFRCRGKTECRARRNIDRRAYLAHRLHAAARVDACV